MGIAENSEGKKKTAMRKDDSEDYGYGRWRLEYQQKEMVPV